MPPAPRRLAPSELLQLLDLGAPPIPEPQKPDGDPPYSRHVGRALRSQTDGPCRGRLAWDTKDAETPLPKRGTWPHRHHGDRSQPQAEAPVQAPRRRPSPGRAGLTARPVRGLGLRAARRPRRRVGTASSQRCPRPGTPAPVRRSHTRFARRRGPTRTQAGAKRGKRSGAAHAQRSCPRGPGECRGLPRKVVSWGQHTATAWERGQLSRAEDGRTRGRRGTGRGTVWQAPCLPQGRAAPSPCHTWVTHDVTMDIVTPPSWAWPCVVSTPSSSLMELCPVGKEGSCLFLGQPGLPLAVPSLPGVQGLG